MENENEEQKKVEIPATEEVKKEEPKKAEAQKQPQEPKKKKKGGALKAILLVIVIIIALVALGLLIRYSIVKDSYFAPFEKLFGVEEKVDEEEISSSKKDNTVKGTERLSLLSEEATAKGVDHYTITVDVPTVAKFGISMFNSFVESMNTTNDGTDINSTFQSVEGNIATGIEDNEEEIEELLNMLDGAELVADIYAKNDELIQVVVSYDYADTLKKVYDYCVENEIEEMEDFDNYSEFKDYVETTLDIYLTKSNILSAIDDELAQTDYDIDIYDYEDDLEINSLDGAYEIYFSVNDDLNEMFADFIEENAEDMEDTGFDADDFLGSFVEVIDENFSAYGISAEKE